MNKEYLDYLYEKRAEIQKIVDDLVEASKKPMLRCCDNMKYNGIEPELTAVRFNLLGINKSIEKYIELHNGK